ncbi:phage major capsid protein [Streptomyces sp. DG2A-72]|uniref:phage major capsid protein n=1 Tax=Streptomyces sp. DG2A-72 TaxID=3051386 RepID=UPI00265C507E|nr:phage major capsid protein [Streptomyces sp. DG2A-72]MDO0938660.1 phage major capsid protein [Streptomyces sp. DG2A-72]
MRSGRARTTNAWQGVTSAGTTAEWKAEHAEASAAEVELDDPSIPVHMGDVDVLYSYEVGMDAIDFLGQLRMVIMDAADQLQATAYTTGTGTGQPKGVITAVAAVPGSVVAGAGTEALASADPYNLVNSLGPRFSANAQFVSHIATANTFRQMETANGSLKFPELRNDPPQFIGKRWTELSNMDGSINPAATATNYALLYGNFQQFVIVDRIGATLEILPAYGANRRPTAQRHAFLTFRTGSDVVVPQAFRLLNVATTA